MSTRGPVALARTARHVVAVLLLALALFGALSLSAPAATAAEGGEPEKVALPENPHDQVGLIILAASGLAVLMGGVNAWRQLRGERPQADGKIRWR